MSIHLLRASTTYEALCWPLCISNGTYFIYQTYEIRKMRLGEVQDLIQGYTASKWWQSQNLNPYPFHCKSTLRSIICRRGFWWVNIAAWKNVFGLRIWKNSWAGVMWLNKPKHLCQINNKRNHHQLHLLTTCQTLCYVLTRAICNTY